MAFSILDPTAAFVAIDLQQLVAALTPAPVFAAVVERSVRLAEAFRARGWPVIWVNTAGVAPGRVERKSQFNRPPGWTELVPAINRQPGDFTVTKYQVGAFYGTGLERMLRRAGASQIFLTGIATSIGVEMAARTAYDHGFNVVNVTDAMADLDPAAHDAAIARAFPRISELATCEEVLARLKI